VAIFNSLGSNYGKGFVRQSLLTNGSAQDHQQVEAALGKQYGGKAYLAYKGRQALELGLRHSGLPAGAKVGINGFTCYVVYQAVERAGYQPVFLDVEPGRLHFGLKQLQAHKDLKAIIVQNTLGLPVAIGPLEAFCRQNKLLLIEDLAHSMGAVYEDGREAGTVGELAMLSFSQDKPLDVVAGGAIIDRRSKSMAAPTLPVVSFWQRGKNRDYPFWTMLIRNTYGFGLGRYIHFVLKKGKLLATPMSDNLNEPRAMSNSAAKLLLGLLDTQDSELAHRRKIAAIYSKELSKDLQYTVSGQPSYLRFPISAPDRAKLVAALKKSRIYISDTWYDAPVAPKRYLDRTNYRVGQCPEAEKLAESIVNLPTHKHVTPEVAQQICAKINQCLASK
jgi:perosamine synthetase